MRKTADYLFLTALIFSPMAFGTVETWSYLVMEMLICASAILLCFSGHHPFYHVPGLRPLLLILVFVLFQVLPLPASIVKFISPATFQIYQDSAGLFGPVHWIPISIYPRATMMEFLRFSTYILFYITAIQLLADRIILKKTVTTIAWFAALLSIIVIIEFITRNLNYPMLHEKVLWVRRLSHGGTPAGPYVNRNHYAGLMEMIFPLMLSLFLVFRPRVAKIPFKKKLVDLFSQKQLHQHFLFGTAAIFIATSIFLSLSRAGIISLTLSMGMFGVLLFLKTKQKKPGILILLMILMVLFLTGTKGWDAIFKRFENIRNPSGEIVLQNGRLVMWNDSKKIIKDFPLLGTGAGTYEQIYPSYRTLPGNDILEHAHNDYIEFLCTGGIIMAALMLTSLFVIFRSSFFSFRRRREKFSIYLFIGCITAISAIMIHSLVDFNMQIGANGLYFFFVLALAVSAANTRLRSGLSRTLLPESRINTYGTGTLALLLCIGVFYAHGGALIGHYLFSDYAGMALTPDMPKKDLSRMAAAARCAVVFDPFNPRYLHAAARTAAITEKKTDALTYFEKSIRQNPTDSRHLNDVGDFFYRTGDRSLAASFFRSSIHNDKKNMAAYLRYAAMLIETGRTGEGREILKSAMSVNPGITDTCLSLMVLLNIEEDQMFLALPDRVMPHLLLGDFFNELGNRQKAETAYLKALAFLPNETRINKNVFIHVYQFYWSMGAYERAMPVILQAISYFPEAYDLHRFAGNLYKKLGISFRAEEEYKKSRILQSQ